MVKSAKAKVNQHLARASDQFREKIIQTSCAAMEVPVHRAEKAKSTNQRQFWVRLN